MTAYGDTDKALLGDFVDSSRFEVISGAATADIRVGRGLMFDQTNTGINFYMWEYTVLPMMVAGPMIGVAFRNRKLAVDSNGILIYPENSTIDIMVQGRIYVNAKIGTTLVPYAPATIDSNGDFGSAYGDVRIGQWLSIGESVTGEELFILELDLSYGSTVL